MAPKLTCPACDSRMQGKSLLSQFSLKPYRVCPDCGARYTSDTRSKRRQVPILCLVLLALGLSLAIGIYGSAWLVPAVLSHMVLWSYVVYAFSKLAYVPYRN